MTAKYLSPEELWNKSYLNRENIDHLDYSHLPKEITKSRQIVWHLFHKINDIPTCQNEKCQNKVKWHVDLKTYRKFCSRKCSRNSIEVQNKLKKISLERYGVENPMQSKEIQNKYKQTILQKYGNFNIKNQKAQETMLKKYGIKNAGQSNDFQLKVKKTNLERYGVENPFQSDEIKEKIKSRNFENYGVLYNSQKHYSDNNITEILLDRNKFSNFIKDKTVIECSELLNINSTTIYRYLEKYNITDFIKCTSYLENKMKEFLEEIGINFIQNTRKIIAPLELDFYLPDYQIAIEMNGDYWHSDEKLLERTGMVANKYHQMKTDRCHELGIELIHISEFDWNNQNEKCKELIRKLINN